MRLSRFLIASLALAAACSSAERSTAGTSPTGGTLIIAPSGDAIELFPVFVLDATGRQVADQIYDHLADIKQDMQTIGDKGFTPRLATKWEWAPDSLSIAFSLDPRAKWHDGKPVTARDVKFSVWAYTDSVVGSPVRPLVANIDSVSIRDSLTPVVWFKKHTPEQFYDVAYQIVVVPEHIFGAVPAKELHTTPLGRTPIGTGRFRFVKWDPGVRIELVADTANYHGRAKLDRLVFAIANPMTAATQVLSGQADFMEAVPPDRVPEFDKSTVARPILAPTAQYMFLAMNQFDRGSNRPHPILSDRRVRRALSMAVDRVGMLKNVFDTTGRIGHGPFPMTVPYADSAIRLPAYDTTAAAALLDSAGWRVGSDGIRVKAGRPLRFNMLVTTTSVPRQRYAELLQEQFRRIGAKADVEKLDFQAFGDRGTKGNFDTILWGFAPDPSPAATRQNWGTAGIGTGLNMLRYSNRKVDALIDSATATFDASEMRKYSSRALQLIADDAPAIFLYDVNAVFGGHRRIVFAPMRLDAWWANLADWSIPPDKRIDRDKIGLRPSTP
jgi:peptide/nickel transport system substrate-binding protein